jgi:hypothetical protein
MGAISILVALILPALAPVAGYLLGKFTSEELKQGKKYFISMQHILFVVISAAFLYSNKWQWWIVALGLLAVFLYLTLKQTRNVFASEALFGIAFALSTSTGALFLLSSLVFIYGLPTGSLFALKKKGGLWKSIIAGLIFAVVAYAASFFL